MMGIHITLLESHDNKARIALHITFMKSIVFEHEISFNVGEIFNLNDVKIETNHPEKNKFEIHFSEN